MKPNEIIDQLQANRLIFKTLLADKTDKQIKYKPDDKSWSILEIICHLYDEEREDFRFRTINTLLTPEIKPPSIDPPGWVLSRKYAKQNYKKKVKAILLERQNSIKKLKSIKNPAWKNTYEHPFAGKMTAYQLLTNWLAHDYHHIRQINRRLYEHLKESSGMDLKYAGDW